MSSMMPEQYDAEGRPIQGTLFNYNDNVLNNIGTFATNELLGVDDFQRAFGNFDRGDISFWDRAKALGAGVGELGTTAALFVPGANVIAGASKIPTIGKVAAKALPFILPSSKTERALGLAGIGAMGAQEFAPQDSFIGQALPYVTLAGLGGLGAAKFIRGRNALTMTRPGTVPSTWTDPVTGLTKTFDMPGEVPISAVRRYNPLIRPSTGKIGKGRLGALLGLGTLAAGAYGMLGQQPTPTAPYTPTTVPGSFATTTGSVPSQQNILDILRGGREQERAIIEQSRQQAMAGFGDAERAALQDYLDMLDIAQRGQTAAIRGDYQNLYDRLAGDVGAIQGMGAAGGAAVERRYRQAARRAKREGARETVSSGVGGLTPVSGAIADMPEAMRGQGRDLAAYIRNNAAVAARDAGFDAETSLEYGNAKANEFAQNIALMGASQKYGLERDLAAQQRSLGSQYDAMLADLARQGVQTESQLAVQEALRQQQVAQKSVTGPQLLADPAMGQSIATAWENVQSLLSGTPPEGATQSMIQMAQAVANELNARYGRVDLTAYAQYLADAQNAGIGAQ